MLVLAMLVMITTEFVKVEGLKKLTSAHKTSK
jgi:hypothetical protein